ncbi:uncharacterized protein LOC108179569 [Tachysurus ichikawai]
MASLTQRGTSPVSLRHGVRCVPANGVSVEEVLLAMGKEVGNENIFAASRMNKAVVVFLKEENQARHLTTTGIVVSGEFVIVSPLVAPTVRVTIANVPPFVPDEDIERELKRYGKVASKVRTVYLGCKNGGLKNIESFRRHVFMSLSQPELDVSFRVVCEGRSFMLYASTGQMKCFECGDVGHKRLACPHKAQASEGGAGQSNVVAAGSETVEPPVKRGADFPAPAVSSAVAPERSGTESDSAVAAMSNTDIHVEKRAEVSITETNPVSGEVVINTGCTESTVQAEISAHDSNTELDSEDVMVNTQVITVGEKYNVTEIKRFLKITKNMRMVNIGDHFPDLKRLFEAIKRFMSEGCFEDKEVYRLKKIMTKLTNLCDDGGETV